MHHHNTAFTQFPHSDLTGWANFLCENHVFSMPGITSNIQFFLDSASVVYVELNFYKSNKLQKSVFHASVSSNFNVLLPTASGDCVEKSNKLQCTLLL